MRLTVMRIAVIFAGNMNEIITTTARLEELARRDIESRERTIWAVVGCAGSGKTTLTYRLEETLAGSYGAGVAVAQIVSAQDVAAGIRLAGIGVSSSRLTCSPS